MCEEKTQKNLTRSEAREQAFMLLFSKSFDDEPLEATIEDNSEMFEGGVCAYAQAVVMGIEAKLNEAVELAKKYTIDEYRFVNGILGSYLRSFEEN